MEVVGHESNPASITVYVNIIAGPYNIFVNTDSYANYFVNIRDEGYNVYVNTKDRPNYDVFVNTKGNPFEVYVNIVILDEDITDFATCLSEVLTIENYTKDATDFIKSKILSILEKETNKEHIGNIGNFDLVTFIVNYIKYLQVVKEEMLIDELNSIPSTVETYLTKYIIPELIDALSCLNVNAKKITSYFNINEYNPLSNFYPSLVEVETITIESDRYFDEYFE